MNYPTAIVLSTTIICGTILMANNAVSQSSLPEVDPLFSGQFQGLDAGGRSIYIVDTSTGRVASCYTASNKAGVFTCGAFGGPPT